MTQEDEIKASVEDLRLAVVDVEEVADAIDWSVVTPYTRQNLAVILIDLYRNIVEALHRAEVERFEARFSPGSPNIPF